MKSSKTLSLFGILAALLALGGTACFNPNSPVSAPAGESGTPAAATAAFNDIDPFTVTIAVNGDGPSRSIAGLPRDQLKAETGVRNFAQLIVLDTASKKLMGFAETTESGTITINALPLGKTYAFFLLMGRRDGDAPPTLLNVGLTRSGLNAESTTQINILMYPVVVDTAFSNNAQTIGPVIEAGKPKPAFLSPEGDWKVKWTIQRTNAGTDGLDRLLAAQAIMEGGEYDETPDHYAGGTLNIRGLSYKKDGAAVSPAPAVTAITNDIEWDISAYTQTAETQGAVNFNVEYAPFNLTKADDWRIAYSGLPVQTACAGGIPAWIIRNGVNDEAPTEKTNFNTFGKTDANANGAVAFIVKATGISIPPDSDKIIEKDLTAGPPEVSPAEKTVVWASGDEEVATVNPATGVVTAVGAGEATITGTQADDPGKTVSYTVTVPGIRLKHTGGEWLNKLDPKNSLFVNSSGTDVTAVVYNPYDGTTPKMTWKRSSGSVTINAGSGNDNKIITGSTANSTAKITVSATINSNPYSVTCNATVINGFVSVTAITGAPTTTGTLNLLTGMATSLTGTASPSDATNKTISWSVVSFDVEANISNNKITAQAKGTAQTIDSKGTVKVRATIVNGVWDGTKLKDFTKDFTLSVYPYPSKIEVYAILVGQNDTNTATNFAKTKGNAVLFMSVDNQGKTVTPDKSITVSARWIKFYVSISGISGASYPVTWGDYNRGWIGEGTDQGCPANSSRIFLKVPGTSITPGKLTMTCGNMTVTNEYRYSSSADEPTTLY